MICNFFFLLCCILELIDLKRQGLLLIVIMERVHACVLFVLGAGVVINGIIGVVGNLREHFYFWKQLGIDAVELKRCN